MKWTKKSLNKAIAKGYDYIVRKKCMTIDEAKKRNEPFTICLDKDIEDGIKKALKELVDEY